jgi:hypothetical protein
MNYYTMPHIRDEVDRILKCVLKEDTALADKCINCIYSSPCSFLVESVFALNVLTNRYGKNSVANVR